MLIFNNATRNWQWNINLYNYGFVFKLNNFDCSTTRCLAIAEEK